jgi:undecaprenyl-diphosphatase
MLGTAAAVVAIGAAAGGALLLMIRTRTGVARTDVPFAEWAAEHATATSTDVMRAISDLGGTNVVVLSAVAAAAIAMVRDRRLAIVAFMAMVVGGQFALSNLIKYAVDRARPTIAPLTGFAGASFPSGHSVAAAATWACIAFVLARRAGRHVRAVAFGAAVGIAVAVGATRVALGVHWTTDVLAGLLIGWAWFALCSIAFGGRLLHFGEPVAVAEAEAERTAADEPIRY